jgi:D-alanyl-D-alanine carboxypeptidase
MNTNTNPASTARSPIRSSIVVALAIAVAGLSGPPATQPPQAASSAAIRVDRADANQAATATLTLPSAETGRHRAPPDQPPIGVSGDDLPGGPNLADGALPDAVTVFDDAYPGVANLDPALLRALRAAATDAAADGVTFYVSSGWRSPAYQEQLLHAAVAEYGSPEEATRWVASAETSAHVTGDAVDLVPAEATAWLARFGAGYGLCQTYRNEPWHFELRPEATGFGCPPMYADAAHDPRLQP